jgi:hypothetical protein
MRLPVPAALVVASLLVLVPSARAEDVVVLKTGREIRGKVLEKTEDRVRIEIAGGSVWYPLDRVQEIRSDDSAAPGATEESARAEHALLYSDGRRVGTRVLRHVPRKDGHQWEEHVVFFGPEGTPAFELRTLERCDLAYRPVFFQVQQKDAEGVTTLFRGEAIGSRLEVTTTQDGETAKEVSDMKDGSWFPFGAREAFLRGEGIAADTPVHVFDFRDRRWRKVTYRDAGERVIEDEAGRAVTVRVIERRKDLLREIEWIGPDGRARLADLNGPSMRALAAEAGIVAAVAAGEPDRVTGLDSAARTLYRDAVHGFAIRKPDPSWLFEEPRNPDAGALLVVRNRPLGASVDVLRDEAPAEGVTLETAGEALERVLRAHAPDLEVVTATTHQDELGGYYELVVEATTKGERTRTLAHVRLGDRGVFRLLAACPADRFAMARPEMEEILLSFRLD